MNNEHAVQIVAHGVVCSEERDYRHAYQTMIQGVEAFREVQCALVAAWFAENYPMVRRRISSVPLFGDMNVNAGTATIIENPEDLPCSVSQMQAELDAYLKELEGR